MELSGFKKRTVRLEEGQILLSLREPGAAKTWVKTGDLQLVDIGTVFEVTRNGSSSEVVVSEGSVVADPEGARLRLSTGQGLSTADGASVLRAMAVEAQAAGGFVRGQLSYRDRRIDHVVRDLRRSTGLDFVEDPDISAHRFTGTLAVSEVKRDPRSLEPLLGVSVERSGQTWRMQRRG
jgi:transmembrane sensor